MKRLTTAYFETEDKTLFLYITNFCDNGKTPNSQ